MAIDDPKWDDYINQFTVESMAKMFSNGGWNELADTDNGVPISYDADSPYGFYAGMLKISQYAHNIWYCGAPMVSATWNLEIADELGNAFAEEAWLFKQEEGFTGTVLTDAGGEPNTYMTTDLALRRGQNLTLSNNGTNGLYDTESLTAVSWLKTSTRYLLYNKANSNAVMGMTPGTVISYGTSPWRIVMYCVWGLTALFAVLNACRIVGFATGKLQAKEKASKKKQDDSDDEY